MEPFTAVQPLAKLLGAGVRAWDTLLSQGFEPRDLQALRAPGQAGDNVVLLPNAAASDAMAHLALLAAAFGRALERKGGEAGRPPGPGLRRFLDQSEQAQMHEIELRLQRAELQMPAPGAGTTPSAGATGGAPAAGAASAAGADGTNTNSLTAPGPLQTAWYRALRDAFSNPLPEVSGEPPLDRQPLPLRAFERQLMLAYWEGIHGALGRVLGPSQNGTPPHRARFLRELLVADIADWGARHVFGNLLPTSHGQGQGQGQNQGQTGPFPFLPLAEAYTEPYAHLTGAPAEPALGLFHRILDDRKTRLVLIKADFGMGKTLTARTMAMRLANIYRDEGSPDVPYPVFVRCAEDLEGENFDLAAAVRRARKHHAEELGLTLDHDDPALGLPDPQSRVVFIVDGLNEVTLGPRWLDSLFDRLRGSATERWQIVVFSRPGLLPSEDQLRSTPVAGMPVLEMLPFRGEEDANGGHLARWLEVWNRTVRRDRSPITLVDLTSRQLHRLAKTPLLLYMIAHAWERYPTTARPTSQAMVFETFFQQVAHDLMSTGAEHRPAAERAARHLTEQLVAHGEIEAGEGAATDSSALLWLLTRVAWEAQKFAQRRESSPLTCRAVTNLLKDELRIGSDDAPSLESAILLALQQTDLRKAGDQGDDRIRISHPAFREFLVARYWADRLKKIVRARERDWPDHARKLLGGRLLGEEDRSYPLLLQIVSADAAGGGDTSPLHWEYRHRKRLVEWAEDCFNDERLVFSEYRSGSGSGPASGAALLREDQRAALREAALAIGSQVVGSPGLKARDPLTLRSLLAWFWLVGERPIVIAPRADLRGSVLDGARLDGARLDGARLDGARLDGAILSRAVLSRAVLEGARLDGARLDGARLDGVKLDGGVLSRAILSHANLDGASLEGVRLDGATLRGAIYDDATHWPKDFAPAAAGAITVAIHRRRELK